MKLNSMVHLLVLLNLVLMLYIDLNFYPPALRYTPFLVGLFLIALYLFLLGKDWQNSLNQIHSSNRV